MKNGIFYGIGAGPGDPELLTLKGKRILEKVDVVFYVSGRNTRESISKKVVDSVKLCKAEKINLLFSMEKKLEDRILSWEKNALIVAGEIKNGRDCAFVTLGDPLLYSTYTYLLRVLEKEVPGMKSITVPGITSFQTAASRINLPMVENDEVLSIIPAWKEGLLENDVIRYSDTVVFMKTYRHKEEIINVLDKNGFRGKRIYASRLCMKDEVLYRRDEDIKKSSEEYLSLIIAKKNNGDSK